ncbi:muscarinic acetylcholine receptor M2-like [Diadema setosum]|uniref:muscarinic acetylcholine receptor M2-like n=1 Tax=Diadema setosum TaxID=31175 RepID=UPI003B3AFB24
MEGDSGTNESFFLSSFLEDTVEEYWGYNIPRIMKLKNVKSFTISGTIVTLIIVSNLISLAAFVAEKRLRTYNNYYIINLAITDLLTGLTLTLDVLYTTIGYYPFPKAVCHIHTGVRSTLVSVSNITIVAICIDRHQAVYDPINHFMLRSKRRAFIMNATCWVLSFVFWTSFTTVWGFFNTAQQNPLLCLPAYSYYAGAALLGTAVKFVLPLVIVAVLYTRIFFRIQKTVGGKHVKAKFGSDATSALQTQSSDDTEREHDMSGSSNHQECPSMKEAAIGGVKQKETEETAQNRESASEMKKATRTLSFIIISFVVAWLPINVVEIAHSVDPISFNYSALPNMLFKFLMFLGYGNGFLNPVAYLLSQPLFRQTVCKLLCTPFLPYRR